MRTLILCIILSFLGLSKAPAEEKTSDENAGFLPKIIDFVEKNPVGSSIKDEVSKKPVKIASLPVFLNFLDFAKKPTPDMSTSLKAKRTEQALWIKNNQALSFYDLRYEEFQELIGIKPEALTEKEKEEITTLFDEINVEINKLEGITPLNNQDEALLGKVGEVVSENFPLMDKRVNDSDPRGPFRKPSFGGEVGPETKEIGVALELVGEACQKVKGKNIIAIDKGLLKKNIESLERALLDESLSVGERIKIYCTLFKFYESTENNTRLINFLYLNKPVDVIKCD